MLKPLNIFKEECSTMFYSKELTFNTKNIVLVPGRVFENIIDKKMQTSISLFQFCCLTIPFELWK